ncbi:septum formation inhibitor Maf [Gramella sp. GC03-9]|uniref:Septum formation inhibitor Maf n=1 Tax=Christiangramia oceanisediminis TaxID=2920386 RepID=A0A9X2RBY3_9FLAO|nr:septum formation inhibitor Maf [Gramella oceanisediminis]MCP9200695.1 septum formation inhibitor Maf [Gramella oceanisediminis]
MRLIGSILFSVFLLYSCGNNEPRKTDFRLSEEFKDYWYSGQAEITSYSLEQSRYGEMRQGEAVLIFVTEDFLPQQQVKANTQDPENTSVLKLNYTKNFLTGIYPYSIMQSTFYPLDGQEHALKVSASIQEWCGQVYMQLNNRSEFEITSHSYFQGEADQDLQLGKSLLENEIWNQLRIDPDELPLGDVEMIPSFEYLRLSHNPTKTYSAFAEIYTVDDLNIYRLNYPELKRELKIFYSRSFPFSIEKWEETYPSGSGENSKLQTTKAEKKGRILSDYWNKNSNKNLPLREKLNLD